MSVDEFNNLHDAMARGLNTERQKVIAERQRLITELSKLEAQPQAIEAQREATQAQRETAQGQRQTAEAFQQKLYLQQAWQNYWRGWVENYERQRRNPVNCNGMVFGPMFTVNCD